MWNDIFLALFEKCFDRYNSGDQDWNGYYTEEDLHFLASIGYQPREFFDFVEDYVEYGDPSPSTALLIASVRLDYFISEQGCETSTTVIDSSAIPSREAAVGDLIYFPRILAKAEAKLRGELDPDLMYCCGGDRSFLAQNGNIHPADFLKAVWQSAGSIQAMMDYIYMHRDGV